MRRARWPRPAPSRWRLADIAASVDRFRERRKRAGHACNRFASILAHAGLGVTLLGVTGTTVWRSEALEVLAPGQSMQVADYALRFDGVTPCKAPTISGRPRAPSK
jgi:cytochrome c biogenesis factor